MKANTVQIYVETTPDVYELLDLFEDEDINLSFKLKDLSNISTVYSIFSQTFTIPATPNNNRILRFYFNTNVDREQQLLSFKSKIYVGTQLFKVGNISVNNQKSSFNSGKSYSLNFFTGVKTLKDIVGEDTINMMSGDTNIAWTDINVRNRMVNSDLSAYPFTVPLISMNRVWTYGIYNAGVQGPNDIFSATTTYNTVAAGGKSGRYIDKRELRPAVTMSYLMDKIEEYYGLDWEIPMKGTTEYDRLMIHLTGEESPSNLSPIPWNGDPFQLLADPMAPQPFVYNWAFSGDPSDNRCYHLAKLANSTPEQTGNITWSFQPDTCFGLGISGGSVTETVSGTITYLDNRTGSVGDVLYTQKFALPIDNLGFVSIQTPFDDDSLGGQTLSVPPTVGNPLKFIPFIQFDNAMVMRNGSYLIDVRTTGTFQHYWHGSFGNNTNEFTAIIQPLKMLPKVKVIDFLGSLCKMFNLRLRQASDSQKLYFERPTEWYNDTLDYTPYTDIEEHTIEKPTLYREFSFKHNTSKYFSNVAYQKANLGNPSGEEFGQLKAKLDDENLSGTYTVETKFSIVPQNVIPQLRLTTQYGFNSDTPQDSPIYGTAGLYKPNLNEITLYYDAGTATLSDAGLVPVYRIGNTIPRLTSWNRIRLADEILTGSSVFHSYTYNNGLGFSTIISGDGWPYKKNLYSNYYEQSIRRLNSPNSRIFTYECYLPTYELTRFDLRNNIIIGEKIFSIEEANLNIVTGKVKLKLMNYTEINANVILIAPYISTSTQINATQFRYEMAYEGNDYSISNARMPTYRIAGYNFKVDGVNTFISTSNTYFSIVRPLSDIGKLATISVVDIFGNVSPEVQRYL